MKLVPRLRLGTHCPEVLPRVHHALRTRYPLTDDGLLSQRLMRAGLGGDANGRGLPFYFRSP